jgi:signal transduction histidine kinase
MHMTLYSVDGFRLADGRPGGLIGMLVDITDRKQMEEALRTANKKLHLLSGITRHDISNQLVALNGYIQLSEGAIDDPSRLREYIAMEQKIADVIASQIRFTKDYEDLGVKNPAWQEVSALVENSIAALPMGNIRLEIGCPGLWVFADPLLEKVFYNLIDNSLRYGGEKMTGIRITAADREGILRIRYEDDGNGISEKDKMQLFTRGYGTRTGLGLFLSREILSITGITITENGEPGKGVRFEIVVPEGAWRFPPAP